MAVKINYDKAFKNLANTWKRIGKLVTQWIYKDAQQGMFQNGKRDNYRSEQYKKYKANNMRRFTDGKRLKTKYATSVSSNETSFVNMILSGQLFRGLKVKSFDNTGVVVGYDPKDAMKIEGNRPYGREVLGLRDENIQKVKDELMNGLSDELKKEMKDINIIIRM